MPSLSSPIDLIVCLFLFISFPFTSSYLFCLSLSQPFTFKLNLPFFSFLFLLPPLFIPSFFSFPLLFPFSFSPFTQGRCLHAGNKHIYLPEWKMNTNGHGNQKLNYIDSIHSPASTSHAKRFRWHPHLLLTIHACVRCEMKTNQLN